MTEFPFAPSISEGWQKRIERMKDFADRFRQERGHADCLVMNAGMTLRKSLVEITDEQWETAMQVNVNSCVYLIRDLFDIIPENSRIIFIGSMMGVYPHGTSLAYGVTKSAVHSLFR